MKRLSAQDDANTATTNANITSGSVTGITDITVADGGTGRSTSTTAYGLLAAGTTATGAHQTLAAGATTEILVGGGASALPVWTTAQGSGAPVRATSPSLTTPTIGVATATSVNKVALTAPATAATLTIANNKTLTVNNSITFAGTDATTMTFPSATDTVAGLAATQTITGPWTFGSAGAVGKLKVAGTTSGSTILDASAVASGTLTLPAATDTLVGKATTDTLTNKTLTTPTIADFTNAAHDHGDADDGGQLVWQALPAGSVIQTVITNFTAAGTTTTTVPFDDTIPQNTEGGEMMTQAITPKSTTSTLIIEAAAFLSHSVSASALSVALYQDSTANALAATNSAQQVATAPIQVPLMHSMAAGTTSSTTFRIRVGSNLAGTTTFNGQSSGRIYGAITKSWMKITEIRT